MSSASCREGVALNLAADVRDECRGADGEEAFQIATQSFGSRFSIFFLFACTPHVALPPPPPSPCLLLRCHVCSHLAVYAVLVGVCGQVAPLALPRGMGLDALVPLPALKTACGRGVGLAVCPALGLLVTSNSDENTLSVFALPRSNGAGAGAGLALVCTLGGAASPAPMQFDFWSGDGYSGWMAFTGPATSRLLLLTDAGHDAVHVIDVVGRNHVGYVAAPGTIAGPRGVAAKGSLVVVSAWKADSGEHVVRVFEGSGAMWTAVRVVAGGFGGPGRADGQLHCPYGLRFTFDDAGLAVADAGNRRVSLFRVEDGSFARHVATGLRGLYDVEECEGGWLVVCQTDHTIEFVGGDVGRPRLGEEGIGDREFLYPSALALVPGLGLVVREEGNDGRFQVFG